MRAEKFSTGVRRGLEWLSGTLPELIALLDGYPFKVLHLVFWPEVTGRTPLYAALKGYYIGRMIQHFGQGC